jgi:hypothetical protein
MATSRNYAILAAVLIAVMGLGFVLLGGWLIACGFGATLGALFSDHVSVVVVILALGIGCLTVAVGLFTVSFMLLNRSRTQRMIREWEMRQKQWKAS